MEHPSLLLPTETKTVHGPRNNNTHIVETSFQTPEGTSITCYDATLVGRKVSLIVAEEGVIEPLPDIDRYPYTARIATLALEHYEQTGKLPEWGGSIATNRQNATALDTHNL